jgi:hypothetical protein
MEHEPQPHIETELLAAARVHGVEANARALIEGVNGGRFAPEGLTMALEAISAELPVVKAQALQFAESAAAGAINASEVIAAAPRIAAENPHSSLYEPLILQMVTRQKREEEKPEESRNAKKQTGSGTSQPKPDVDTPSRPSTLRSLRREHVLRRPVRAVVAEEPDSAMDVFTDDEEREPERKARTRREVARMLVALRSKQSQVEKRVTVAATLDRRDATLQRLEDAVEAATTPELSASGEANQSRRLVVDSQEEENCHGAAHSNADHTEHDAHVSAADSDVGFAEYPELPVSPDLEPVPFKEAVDRSSSESVRRLIATEQQDESFVDQCALETSNETQQALKLVEPDARIQFLMDEERSATTSLVLQELLASPARLRLEAVEAPEQTAIVVFEGQTIRLARLEGETHDVAEIPEYRLALIAPPRDDRYLEDTHVLDIVHQLPILRSGDSNSHSRRDELGSPLRLDAARTIRARDDGADTLAIPAPFTTDGRDRLLADTRPDRTPADPIVAVADGRLSGDILEEGFAALLSSETYPPEPSPEGTEQALQDEAYSDDPDAPVSLAQRREQRRIEQDEYDTRQVAAIS